MSRQTTMLHIDVIKFNQKVFTVAYPVWHGMIDCEILLLDVLFKTFNVHIRF